MPARRISVDELPTVGPEQRVNHPIFSDGPFLAIVSQNKRRITRLFSYEVFGLGKRCERTYNALTFNHYERVGGMNYMLTKQSRKHTRIPVAEGIPTLNQRETLAVRPRSRTAPLELALGKLQ
jgi:hypothetical protein